MDRFHDRQFDVLDVTSQWVAYRRVTCAINRIGETITAPNIYPGIYALAAEQGVKAGPPYARYIHWRADDCDILCGIPIDGPIQPRGDIIVDQYTACRIVTLHFVGPYHELGLAHDAVIDYIKRHNLKHGGPCWEIYDGPGDENGNATTHVCYALEP